VKSRPPPSLFPRHPSHLGAVASTAWRVAETAGAPTSASHVTCHSHSSPSVLSISTSAAALLFDDKSTSTAAAAAAAAANVPALPRPPPPPPPSAEAALVESPAPSSPSPTKRVSSKAHGLQTRHSAHVDDVVCLMTAIASSCSGNMGSNLSSGVGGTVSCLAALHRLSIALPPPPSVFPHASSLVQCLFCHAISQVLGLSPSAISTNFFEPLLPNTIMSLITLCASSPTPLQSLVLVPSSLPSPSPIRADLTAACSVVLWVTGTSACIEKLAGGCLDVSLLLLPLLKVRYTRHQCRCGSIPPRCRMCAWLLSLTQLWHQENDASIDVAVASLDAALMHTRRMSSGSDCRVTSDASASVCAVTWLLSQQQSALFGRAACAWHIMTSLLVLQFF
jgi:hypothetical protein